MVHPQLFGQEKPLRSACPDLRSDMMWGQLPSCWGQILHSIFKSIVSVKTVRIDETCLLGLSQPLEIIRL